MSKRLIFRNKCFFSTYLSYSGSYYTYEVRVTTSFFFNSEFNEKQQVNQLSEHVAVKNFLFYFFVNLNFYNFILKQLTTYILCMYQNSNFVAVISSNTEQNFSFFNRIFFVYDDQRNQKRKKKELHAISRKKKYIFKKYIYVSRFSPTGENANRL